MYLPSTALKARFVMIEEGSKILYDVDLATSKLGNPSDWKKNGISPSNTGDKLAIVIPNRLTLVYKQRIASAGQNPNFETGKLVAITRQEDKVVYGNVIGRVNVCPFDDTVMSWEKIKEYKKEIIHDEMKNGLLAKVYGGKDAEHSFVHPERLASMPRKWHENADVLNTELDGIFASGDAIAEGQLKWWLAGDDSDND